MQLFGDARQISYEVRRPERGIAGLTPCVAGGRRTSSPKRGYQSSRHLGIGQYRKGCRRNATLVVASRARLPVPHHTPVPQRHRIGNGLRLIAIDHRGRGGAFILTCYYEYRVPRCQHIKTNGTQCGSPALRNGEYCYFHRRWRMTTVDLSHSAHHVTTEFVLPVLEDADSIQITLGQIMRMIVCRQVDTKSAGLLLYALQIASANLRRTGFEPYHRNVTVDLFRVPERIIGDEAWSPADFKDANVGNVGRAPSPAKPSSDKESSPEKQSDVGRASPLAVPSPAKETAPTNESSLEKQLDVGRASPLAVPLSAEETHVARTPSSAKESCVVATLPEPQPGPPSPATQSAPASNVSSSSLPSATEQRELQKAVRALPRRPEGRLARCKNTI